MKKLFFVLSSLFIFIGPIQILEAAQKMSWDIHSDQQIESCFSRDTFQNISILYSHEHQNWELRIIFNPKREKIEVSRGKPSMFQFYYGVFSRDPIPESLKNHLQEVIESKLGDLKGGHWGLASTLNDSLMIDYYADAVPSECAQPKVEKEAPQTIDEVSKIEVYSDQAISDLFKAKSFQKLSLDYEWEGKKYPIHFVYNPLREPLMTGELSRPFSWPFAMTIASSSYPLNLPKHIKSLIPSELLKDPESMVDVATWIRYYRTNPVSVYTTLSPVTFLNQIENPEIDAEIRELFHSQELAKKSLWYELDGNYYGVLLIHNPEKLNLYSKISFETNRHGNLNSTLHWSSKIGIFVNELAPQKLIDHITQLCELSWWDSTWNLSIYNGDKVSISHLDGDWKYTYTPETWYTSMLRAKL